jgi:glycosyltransferase involved in cell wall biosynthesis
MRVALVTPVACPAPRGNAVTVARLACGLGERGIAVTVVDLSRTSPEAAAARLAATAPEVVHAFHAFRGGPAAAAFAGPRGLPLVVSLTGTDANHDLVDPERGRRTREVLRAATALVVFHPVIAARVVREVPEVADRIAVIPQSVRLGDAPFPADALPPRQPGEVRFLLAAGIRRVKNVLLPLSPLGQLALRYPIRLLLAGPVIEPEEGARLRAALEGIEWARYLGAVPHAQMASLLDQVDVVVNSSLSEGGMANSVLEAMSRGKAVLASDIEGNRSVIEDEVDGLLFADAAGLRRQAERLIRDPGLRARLGAAARAKIERLCSPAAETEAYLALYRRLAGARAPALPGPGAP